MPMASWIARTLTATRNPSAPPTPPTRRTESGNGGWTGNGNWAYASGAWSTGFYTTFADDTVTSPSIDASGTTRDLAASFGVSGETESGYDYLYLEYSSNGGADWTEIIARLDGPLAGPYTAVLPGTAGASDVRVRARLTSDSAFNEEGANIEDVSVTETEAEVCDDSIDNDLDGAADCFDTDCSADPACASGPAR